MQKNRWTLRIIFSLFLIVGIGLIVWGPTLLFNSDKEAWLTADLPAYFPLSSSTSSSTSAVLNASTKKGLATERERALSTGQSRPPKSAEYLEKVAYGDHTELGEIVYSEQNRFQDAQVLDAQITRPDHYGFFEKSFLLDAQGEKIQILAREKWSKSADNGELIFHGTNYIAGNQIMVKIRPQASPAAAAKLFQQAGLEVLHFEPYSATYQLTYLAKTAKDYQLKIEEMLHHTDLIESAFPNLLIIQSRDSLRDRAPLAH